MKWNKVKGPKEKYTKSQPIWLGPFQILEKIGLGTYTLQNLEGDLDPLPINGQCLNQYFNYLL